jgi:hypothetical protein
MRGFFGNVLKVVKRAEMAKSRIPKLKVAGSNPVSRSNKKYRLADPG